LGTDGETVNGVTIVQEGDADCPTKAGTKLSFTTELTCDATITTVDPAVIVASSDADKCHYTVAFAHEAGCPIAKSITDITDAISTATDDSLGWLYENEWAIGIIYVVFGPLIALFGASWFPYIVASLVAIFTIGVVCGLSLAFGWMATGLGTGLTIGVAFILGILGGCFVRRNIKVMLGLLGMIAGFFSGSLIFALIAASSGWNAVWGFWVISVVMAIIGCVAAVYVGMPLVMTSTSLVGSYLFMRSWTLFFPGNYPSEAELIDSKGGDLEIDAFFWVFISIFVVSFIGSLAFQCKYATPHKELDDEYGSSH